MKKEHKKEEKKDWKQFKEEHEIAEEGMIEEGGEEDGGEGGVSTERADSPHEAALDHPSYIALEEKLTVAEQKAHEHWEKSVRALAELDNVRRRAEREVANAHRYGVEKLITALLPVIDSIEQALQMANKDNDSAMFEGLELTHKLFIDVLEKFDVQQLDPTGALFDPQMHEAMSILEVEDTPPNTVITVFQKGYKLSERVIRPARVVVSKSRSNQ